MVMEQQSSNTEIKILPFRTISEVTDESIKYIDDRRKHIITPLKTRWGKFNKVCCGGIEPNMIFTVAGGSGSGKSAFTNTLETDLIDLNKDQEVVILSFSFEMVSSRNIGRKISNKLRRTTSELYSAEEDLTDEEFAKVKSTASAIKKYQIYYVDTPSSVEEIEKTIDYFYSNVTKGKKWLIVILDHVLLVEGDGERSTISGLQKMFIRKKKLPYTTIIQISQLNRNIEQPDRINNPSSHYPMRSDLFASDAIFQASDYVVALSRPELLNLQFYGVNRLPIKNKVYLHFLKVRDAGEPCILSFENELKYGNLIESVKSEEQKENITFIKN